MLAVEGVTQRYGAREALRDVSFTVAPGETVAVIGPNGAGKTTLLQILAGALTPTTGSVSVAPEDVGWVPQQAALYGKLSVAENLRLFARLEKGKQRGTGLRPHVGTPAPADVQATVERMLAQTGLAERAGDEVSTLSGGNRQRVNIAIGLLGDPAVLLLDEPSASLDPRQRERLWEFVGALDATVLYSTHDVSEAECHADRVLVLADGEVLHLGAPIAAGDFVAFLRERGH